MDRHPTYVILMGPPASGKGTQADRLQESLALPHVASGDLFRYNLKNQTELGLKAKGFMDRGELVPDGGDRDGARSPGASRLCQRCAPRWLPAHSGQAEALDKALAARAVPSTWCSMCRCPARVDRPRDGTPALPLVRCILPHEVRTAREGRGCDKCGGLYTSAMTTRKPPP